MPIGICERSQRPSDSPSSPGMAMSRMARWKVSVSASCAHGVGVLGGRHLIAVRAEILGDGVPQIGLVLDYGDPGGQGNRASAIGGK